MAKGLKIATGVLKGAVGCATFAGSCVLNSVVKGVTGGIGMPCIEGNPIQEAKELSKYWFTSAAEDFEEATKE